MGDGFAEHARRARERWAASPVGDEPVTLALHTADPGDPVLSDEVRETIHRRCEQVTRFPGPRDVDPARAAGLAAARRLDDAIAEGFRHLADDRVEAVRIAAEQGWRIEVDDLTFGPAEVVGPNYRIVCEQTARLVRPRRADERDHDA